jgi:hypothetical protein
MWQARDKTMKPIIDASNKILRSLQTLSDKLQPCRQTLATMTNMFGLIDLSVRVLFNNGVKDKSLEENMTLLEQTAVKFGQQIEYTESFQLLAITNIEIQRNSEGLAAYQEFRYRRHAQKFQKSHSRTGRSPDVTFETTSSFCNSS